MRLKSNESFLLAIVVLIFHLVVHADGRMCVSFHDFDEDGKERTMIRDACGAVNGYCVKAIYYDEDPVLKRGISHGCDINDCEGVDDPDYGWDDEGCRAQPDFGSGGILCCCNDHDYCNGVSYVGQGPSMLWLPVVLLVAGYFAYLCYQ